MPKTEHSKSELHQNLNAQEFRFQTSRLHVQGLKTELDYAGH